MAATIECPECGTTLRPAKPVAAGKKLRCPKCEHTFAVPDEDEDVEERRATAVKKKSAAPKKPVPKKAAPAPAPAPAPLPKIGDDDDEGGAYGVAQTPEEDAEAEANKPNIVYVPEDTVRDPRGAATATLATPSTFILVVGSLMAVGGLVMTGVFTWPFMFSKDGTAVKPIDARVEYLERKHEKEQAAFQKKPAEERRRLVMEDKAPKKDPLLTSDEALPDIRLDELNKEEKQIYDEMKEEDVQFRITWGIVSFIVFLYGGFMAGVSVKMTTLESYKWAMTASILAMVSLLALPFGLWALTLLKRDEIKAAFEYRSEGE